MTEVFGTLDSWKNGVYTNDNTQNSCHEELMDLAYGSDYS